MSNSGPPRVNYTLRPAKNVERKMMCEALARLAAIAPLSEYRYVGFGSHFFNDFALYHQRLGIKSMVSIERDAGLIDRCNFNKPFKCIALKKGDSSNVLPELSWKPRTIFWLDYTGLLNKAVLWDAALIASKAASGSALIITVNADDVDRAVPQDEAAAQARIDRLYERVDSVRVPSDVTGASLAKWGLAAVSRRIITNEIEKALVDRNGAIDSARQVTYKQCFNFHYSDSSRMLTVGGLLVNEADQRSLDRHAFDGLPFLREGADPLLIAPPVLTPREIRHLNQMLPQDGSPSNPFTWLSKEEFESYCDVYRYFPVFAESEL